VHNNVHLATSLPRPFKSAHDVTSSGQVSAANFNHLALTFCRCLGIPARYATGYSATSASRGAISDGLQRLVEAYLDGRWFTFDARHNTPRIGRVLMPASGTPWDVAITTSFGPTLLEKLSSTRTRWPEPAGVAADVGQDSDPVRKYEKYGQDRNPVLRYQCDVNSDVDRVRPPPSSRFDGSRRRNRGPRRG